MRRLCATWGVFFFFCSNCNLDASLQARLGFQFRRLQIINYTQPCAGGLNFNLGLCKWKCCNVQVPGELNFQLEPYK